MNPWNAIGNKISRSNESISCACHLLACCQQSYKTVYLYWVWGEESLELEKALLGERAMAEAVGWVGGIS